MTIPRPQTKQENGKMIKIIRSKPKATLVMARQCHLLTSLPINGNNNIR